MTTGNMLDLAFFMLLNLIGAYSCYTHFYPAGYQKEGLKYRLRTRKAFFQRWSLILLSCIVGSIYVGVSAILYFREEYLKFKELPWN